ncbi:MAG: hypothetical protein CMH85_06845 [Novosphingobium sp.]|jgi:hypothetical protein|nr:hypothetical protein [Novosphingobium sp.]|tara:strand:+ start:500 stop:709 length:210 start_codon:yes stop_codon:yes gene_type:complete
MRGLLAAACALPSAGAFAIAFTVSAPLPAKETEAKEATSLAETAAPERQTAHDMEDTKLETASLRSTTE